MSLLKQFRIMVGNFCHRQALSTNGSASTELWLNRAARYGHLQSRYDMATMKGIATPWETLLEIADGGYPPAQNLCAIALIIGDLKTRPCAVADVDLLRPSITGTDGPRLAKLQAEGPRLALPKEGKISRYHSRSSYFWRALASRRISDMPLERDYARAFDYLSKAKETGCPIATNNLAVCLELGLGTPVDAEKARQYYLEAAASEPESKFNAGRCHEFGIGGAVDIDKAMLAYTSAKKLSAAQLGLLRIRKAKLIGGSLTRVPAESSEAECIVIPGDEPLRYALTLPLDSSASLPAYRLTCMIVLCGGDLETAEREFPSLFSHASTIEKRVALESAEYLLENFGVFSGNYPGSRWEHEVMKLFGLSTVDIHRIALRNHALTSPRGIIMASRGDGFSVDQLLNEAQLQFKAYGEEISVESLGLAWAALGKPVRGNSDAWMKAINYRWKNRIGFNNARAIADAAIRQAHRRSTPKPDTDSLFRFAQGRSLTASEMKSLLNLSKPKEKDPPALPEPTESLLAKLIGAPLDSTRLFMLFCLLRSIQDVTIHSTGGGGDDWDGQDYADEDRKSKLAEIPDTPQELTDGSIRSHILRSPVYAIHENVNEIMALLAQGYHYERRFVRYG
jgi:hypothetical protein